MTAGITFDAGGLIALDRDDRQVIVLLARAARPVPESPSRQVPWLRRSADLNGKPASPD